MGSTPGLGILEGCWEQEAGSQFVFSQDSQLQAPSSELSLSPQGGRETLTWGRGSYFPCPSSVHSPSKLPSFPHLLRSILLPCLLALVSSDICIIGQINPLPGLVAERARSQTPCLAVGFSHTRPGPQMRL